MSLSDERPFTIRRDHNTGLGGAYLRQSMDKNISENSHFTADTIFLAKSARQRLRKPKLESIVNTLRTKMERLPDG